MTAADGEGTLTAPRKSVRSSQRRRLGFAVLVLGLLSLFIAPFFVDLVARDGPRAERGVIRFARSGQLNAPMPLAGEWTLSWRGGEGGPPPDARVAVAVPGRWSAEAAGRPALPEA